MFAIIFEFMEWNGIYAKKGITKSYSKVTGQKLTGQKIVQEDSNIDVA